MLAVYVAVGHARWLLWGGHAAWLASAHQPWEVIPAYGSALFRYGREALMVFFVLSGFFIHFRDAGRGGRGEGGAAQFLRQRWHRIAPPYYFALVVTVVCDLIGRTWWPLLYAAQTGDPLLDSTFSHGGYSSASVLPAMVVLPASLGRDFGSNGPIWSLAFEAVYYAIYPAWLWVRRRSRAMAFIGIPALCLLSGFAPIGAFPATVLLYYPIWLAGACLAEYLVRDGVPRRSLAIGGAMFAAGALLYLARPPMVLLLSAAIVFGAGLVLAFAGSQSRDRVVLPVFEFLGLRSYSIFIVHFPVLVLLSAYLFQTQGGRPLHGWAAVAGLALAVAAGCACFEACERHFVHSRYRDPLAAA